MRILITGGAGYIGSHTALALLEAGYDVSIFDNLSTGFRNAINTLSKLNSEGKFMEFHNGNLLIPTDIDDALSNGYDAVMHFASFSQVCESMANPAKYYRNNVTGTINLLDSMKKHHIDKIVFSSTAAVYGEPLYTPIDENHPQKPINPYGQTKLDIEHMMDDYDRTYGIRSARLRCFNVAGADSQNRVGECHDPETHLIPNILKSTFGDGKVFKMFGDDYPTRDGTCIRDYVNVEDLAEAHLLALDYLLKGGKTDYFNLGTSEGSTVKEVFDACEKIVGKKIPVSIEGRRPGDPATLIADNKKAKEILGWEPKRTLEDSVRTAYLWEQKKKGLIS